MLNPEIMNVEKIIFINRAPFEHLELNFKEKGINVLTAINGKGKTTIISHIVDALHELARPHFSNSYEGKENKYYRVSTSLFSLDQSKPSVCFIRFKEEGEIIDYLDCRGAMPEEEFAKIVPAIKINYGDIKSRLAEGRGVKVYSQNARREQVRQIFDKNIITYFPAYRYEQPAYLNDPYKQTYHFKQEAVWNGFLPNPIEVISGIQQLANWILDVVLDGKVYEDIKSLKTKDGEEVKVNMAPETMVQGYLNGIISNILSSKKIGNVRLGIGKRNLSAQRVALMHDKLGIVAPNIFCLSSGESSLLSIFGEILRQADNLRINMEASEIQGLVLIDEVEKHLHISLQKEVLPKLFALFPNVQFIVSSHSPFLSMGLAEHQRNRSLLIDLDNEGVSISPEENAQYKEVYNMMLSENQRFADDVKSLANVVNTMRRPLIITEGKTDWKHLKAALSFFKARGEFADLDIEIHEYNDNLGDSKLHKLLEQHKLMPTRHPIIGVFDCDEDIGKKIYEEGGKRKYNDNVWGLSIDIPEFRKYNTGGISIEFLYPDNDLKKTDQDGRRLFVTSEFREDGRLKENPEIGVENYHDVKAYTLPEREKIQCDEVIHIRGNSLALSKEDFATKIYTQEPPFDTMDFSAFKTIFERIKNILQAL